MSNHVTRLKNSHFFRSVPHELLVDLASESVLTSHQDGTHLWRAGDGARDLCIIQRGLVELRQATSNGDSTLVGLFGPHESIEEVAVLDRGVHASDAVAVSDTVEVLRVRAARVIEALATRPCNNCRLACMALAVRDSVSVHVELLQTKIDIMSVGPTDKRLATLLLHLLDRFGDEDDDGMLVIPVALSRGHLARYVGTRIETVIRVLSRWRKQGWFESMPGGFRIKSSEPLSRILAAD